MTDGDVHKYYFATGLVAQIQKSLTQLLILLTTINVEVEKVIFDP